MFERFRAVFAPRREQGSAGDPWLPERLVAAQGYAEFAGEFAGVVRRWALPGA